MSDQLIFGSFLALTLHGVVAFGVSFTMEKPSSIPPTLEITLAQHPDSISPDEAKFLAQHNQAASGTIDKSLEQTTDQQTDYNDRKIKNASSQAPQEKQTLSQQQNQIKVVSSRGKLNPAQEAKEQGEHKKKQEEIRLSAEIASLKARLDSQRQAYAQRPRKRAITAVATKRADDAAYLNQWRERIESFGNIHYPEKARNQDLYGDVRMLVLLKSDGTLEDASVLQSSGHRILDDAALQIVRQASPFNPFPKSMKKDTDILEVIRTWRFVKGDFLTSSAN